MLLGEPVFWDARSGRLHPGDRPVSEETPVGDVPVILRSALAAEQQLARQVAFSRSELPGPDEAASVFGEQAVTARIG